MLDYLTTQALIIRIWATLQRVIGASDARVPRLAAVELDNLYTDYATRSQPVESYEFITHIWEAFLRLAGQVDHNGDGHSQLARVILWLRKLPLRQLPEVLMLDDSDGYHEPRRMIFLWDGLNRIDRFLPPFRESLLRNEAEFQQYLNTHAFAALLTEIYLISVPRQAMSAIEEVTEGTVTQINGEEVVTRNICAVEHLDKKAAVAGVWLVHAAYRLWHYGTPNNISQGGPWWQSMQSRLSDDNWSPTAMHLERLWFWRNQFDEILDHGDVSAMTFAIVAKAVDKMDGLFGRDSRED
ncbi:hypothetical protein BDV32DRAFT_145318 [Aspergillus pseudonomiae]|uniref:Uncharacterized protein n=1 Tax=Aspergillus pseudonomiae TaxID=1506151 RepID=A0A5N6ID35_9EURO|nr:uncharacterized protein BDV37DRAFT_281229 [Aspergillus pseudonomiae]KAB8264641.1 hypothetical protein BDV32DRAFT_145318 [Aspergillus pseudonomiae]KAE8405982.1 hypothetical protein BDV37DRAFT_281229 [Aspergillus pseudonomiae]